MRALLLLSILVAVSGINESRVCPTPCFCKHVGPQAERLKVTCKDIQEIKDVDINGVSVELFHLDLSKNNIYVVEPKVFRNLTNLKRLDLSVNKITALSEGSFGGLESLERLDLSKNQISIIDAHTFRQLPNLKKLDLSGNKLSKLEPILFHDLLALERLKLNGNALKRLAEGTVHGLPALKQLDLSNNPWECDCYMFWFGSWKNNSVVKLNPPPTCDSPPALRGQPLVDIRLSEHLECQWTSPVIEIRPGQSQVVFAGDSITLKCRAPSVTEDRSAKLNWLWNPNITADSLDTNIYVDPQTALSNVKIENRYLSDSGIVDSSLSIVPVREEHHGQWNCLLVSVYGNRSKAINMIVISEKTRYCPLAVTRNNKGMYAWPRTVVGWRVELPCEGSGVSSFQQIPLRASYRCNSTGHWVELDTEDCPYVSPMTKALEQYSKVNLSLTKGNLLDTARRFKNHTGEGAKITDPVEIHFIAKTVENYLTFLSEEKELGAMLVDIVSAIMNLPKEMLRAAQTTYKACARLVKAVEVVTEFTPAIQAHKRNMALEEFRVKRESFAGLTCTWYSGGITASSTAETTRLLHCATNNKSAAISTRDKIIEASIQLPPSLLAHPEVSPMVHQLMISMYSDNSLFPRVTDTEKLDVTSCVVGGKLIGLPPLKLTEPVYVMLKAPRYFYVGVRPKPVVWDEKLNDTGGWTSDDCHFSNQLNDLVVFKCYRLGYYGLLEDTSYLDRESLSTSGAKFHYSNPAIYVGSLVAIVCLTCTAVTYIICYASIVMPKKAKHCVVNTWVAIALLCFLYTAGIQQTDSVKICQGVGLVLHYLSLCCLLWMAVSASNMYKRLAKSDVSAVPDDEIPDQPIQKPLLGLYLVGWGIALIVCGISGAINLREYAGYSFCFLTSGAALAALFVPAVILVGYLTIFYLLVRCAIRSVDMNGQLSEGTQATENMDLELLEPHSGRAADQNSVHSTQTMSSEVEDLEHSQITQLKGHIVILILYLLAWTSGAAATSRPFDPHVPHEVTIFSVVYAVSASALGLFVLLFYGIARSDVRSQWMMMRCWLRRRKNRCCRTRSVSDANPSIPAQPLVQTRPPPTSVSQATQVISDSNSVASSRHTSASRACNTLKVSELGLSGGEGSVTTAAAAAAAKVANVNLVVMHRQQYRSNNSVTTYTEPAPSCVEMFYNPHQSGVARKFFKKQRRHTKHNNLGPRKQGDGGVTSDGGSCISIPRRPAGKMAQSIERNIFGSGAKVNNTNIHVELNPVNDAKNVNILSDSGGSVSEDRTAPMRYVIGQENLRNAKKMNNERGGGGGGGAGRQDCAESFAMLPASRANDARRKPEQQPLTSASPNESDQDSRTYEEKLLRNVSQQCSLEYSSGLESTQMTSERSDHDLPEICETPETPEKIALRGSARSSSMDEMNDAAHEVRRRGSPQRSLARSDHSNSLFCLPVERYHATPPRNSYRSSMNDVTSSAASSNRDCGRDSRASLDEFNDSADNDSRPDERTVHRGSCKSVGSSRRSLADASSFNSESNAHLFDDRAPVDAVNCVSVSSATDESDFRLLGEMRAPHVVPPAQPREFDLRDLVDGSPDDARDSFLGKEYNSMTDLGSIDGSLGPTRNLDVNSSIEYEDTNFGAPRGYEDTEEEEDGGAYTDGESSVHSASVKKETSV